MNLEDIFKPRDYHFPDLWMFKYDIDLGMSAFRRYVSSNEELMTEIHVQFRDMIARDEELKQGDEYYQASYYAHYYEREEDLIREIQTTHRFSTFVSIFSFFEGRLKSICEQLEMEITPSVSLKNVMKAKTPNDDLSKFHKFLTKVFAVKETSWKDEFEKIRELKTLRNQIVHSNASIRQKDISIVKSNKGLSLTYSNKSFVISDSMFLVELLDLVDRFFNQLIESIDDFVGDFQKNQGT